MDQVSSSMENELNFEGLGHFDPIADFTTQASYHGSNIPSEGLPGCPRYPSSIYTRGSWPNNKLSGYSVYTLYVPAGTEDIPTQSGHSEVCGIVAGLSLLAEKKEKRSLMSAGPFEKSKNLIEKLGD